VARIYYDADVDLSPLRGRRIAVIGFGSQGHAQAQNLRDSGLDVVVAELPGTEAWERATSAGMEVLSTDEAVRSAEIVQVLVPDELQPQVYEEEIGPYLKEGNALGFSHGFNIHFGQIIPPPYVDVFMVAPKAPGAILRRAFLEGQGVPALVAVHQDASGKAREVALAYAKGIGATRAGVIQTTFREETETDLFGEQAVLFGGLTELMKAGFDILVEAGYQPEVAYFECFHEMKLVVDLIYEGGISWMARSVSTTAQYGGFTRGKRVINTQVRHAMREILAEIQSGEFAREWILESQANRPVLRALIRQSGEHLAEKVGRELRRMIPWIEAKEMPDLA